MKRLWLAAILALPALAGCGGSSSSSSSTPPAPTPRSAAAVLPNGLTATLTADKAVVPVGGTVTYTMTLTNSTAQAVVYHPVNGGGDSLAVPAYLTVLNPSGQPAYPVGPTTNLISIGQAVTLAPGQSVSEVQAVDTNTNTGLTIPAGYASAGTYRATVSFEYVPGAALSGGPFSGANVGPVSVQAQ